VNIKILCLGKSKKKYIENGVNEYLKRLTKYSHIKFEILPDVKLTKTINIEIVKEKEAVIIEKHISENSLIICLDEHGKQLTSLEFSVFLNKINQKNIIFIIGGIYGISSRIIQKADLILSFSHFTFTHQMIRLLLIEQIYRAFTIIKGKKYHY